MHRRLLSCALVAGALVSATASATVVIAQTIEEMAREAPLIVRGNVVAVQTRWDDGNRQIWTYAEIRVAEAIKGKPGSTVLVRSPGGVVGEKGQRVAGAAKFAVGEDVLVFLDMAPDDATAFNVWSLAAGKVTFAKRLGELRALRELDGIAFQPRPGAKIWNVDQPDLGPADKFLLRVRHAALAAGGAK